MTAGWDPMDPAGGLRIAEVLGLKPLPAEGGLFRQTFADGRSTAIYYLLAAGDFSALHRLAGAEVYHHYVGAPVRLLLLDEVTGDAAEPVLGADIAVGQRPQLAVPGGLWQGSSPVGGWALLGTTMAPPFAWDDFELGDREALSARFPNSAEHICELTRPHDDPLPD